MVVPACEKMAEARKAGRIVTADQYPYVASSTKLAAMVIPHWALQGNEAAFARIADDPERGPRLPGRFKRNSMSATAGRR